MKPVIFPFLLILGTQQLPAASDPIASNSDSEWSLMTRIASEQYQQHKMADAAASANRAVRLAKHYGSTDDRVAVNYYLLGNIYRDWGHCAEARSSYSHAIAIWEKDPDTNHRYLFDSMASLLSNLCECDEIDSAARLLRAYDSKLRLYQSSLLDESRILSIRAAISQSQKKYKQAENHYREAIELLRQTPKAPRYLLLHEQIELAAVINKQGRHAESLAESQQIITLLEHDGTPSAALLWSLNSAGCALSDLGRKEEAQRMFERLLPIALDFYGEESRSTAKIMLNYARVLHDNKETPAAEAMKKRGAEAFRRSLTRDSATVDVAELRP